MNVSDAELQNLRSFHGFTAWVFAAGIGVLSSVAVFMSFVGS
jgi:hypothetical protein